MRKVGKRARLPRIGTHLLLTRSEQINDILYEPVGDLFRIQSVQSNGWRGMFLGSSEPCLFSRSARGRGDFRIVRKFGGSSSVIYYDGAYVMTKKEAALFVSNKREQFREKAKSAARFAESFETLAAQFMSAA